MKTKFQNWTTNLVDASVLSWEVFHIILLIWHSITEDANKPGN